MSNFSAIFSAFALENLLSFPKCSKTVSKFHAIPTVFARFFSITALFQCAKLLRQEQLESPFRLWLWLWTLDFARPCFTDLVAANRVCASISSRQSSRLRFAFDGLFVNAVKNPSIPQSHASECPACHVSSTPNRADSEQCARATTNFLRFR